MSRLRNFALVAVGLCLLVGLAWRSGDRPLLDEVALARERTGAALESRRIDVGELSLHAVLAGPEDGRPVVLLHGFPEFWWSWHRPLAALGEAGFRAVAPDLRGYNRSDKPRGAEHYDSADFVADVLGLMDALGWQRASLAGHDVGGGVAWDLVYAHPERFDRALIFNAGSPAVTAGVQPEDDPESISWFRTFFRLPFLPELVARSGGWWLLSRNLRQTSRAGTFDDDIDVYKAAWARENAISTMLNSYRAEPVEMPGIPEDGRPTIPVRLVWGERDAFIPLRNGQLSAELLEEGAARFLPEASHWILNEEPEITAREMIEFFGGPSRP